MGFKLSVRQILNFVQIFSVHLAVSLLELVKVTLMKHRMCRQ